MKERTVDPLFLERESFRRRRLVDAARLVPALGVILLSVPGFFTETVHALIYIFTIWALLILFVGRLSRRIKQSEVAGDFLGADDPIRS